MEDSESQMGFDLGIRMLYIHGHQKLIEPGTSRFLSYESEE